MTVLVEAYILLLVLSSLTHKHIRTCTYSMIIDQVCVQEKFAFVEGARVQQVTCMTPQR